MKSKQQMMKPAARAGRVQTGRRRPAAASTAGYTARGMASSLGRVIGRPSKESSAWRAARGATKTRIKGY